MTSVRLITLNVKQLKPGMVVHSITKQTGRLEVKNKGKIKHSSIIEQLIACGVQEVRVETQQSKKKAIEPSKPFAGLAAANDPQLRASETKAKESITLDKVDDTDEYNYGDELFEGQSIELDDELLESEQEDYALNETDLDFPIASRKPASSKHNAFENAEQLVIDCKKLHKSIKVEIEKGVDVDFTPAKAIVSELYQNLLHNPDALLCLSMIRNEGEYLTNHAMHTAILLCYFAQYLGMSENDAKRLALVGYFFDIGMTKVPKDILNKRERPSYDEQQIIQTHVRYSLELLTPLNLDKELRLAIEQHHERLDGSGYPNGLTGEQIHKYSRMLAIVDCYEAMTTNRPFQKKSSPAAALKLLTTKEYGYDLKLALQFVRCMGVYPIGSLVILSNKHIAMVMKQNKGKALLPVVKSFYSISHNDYTPLKEIDLASTQAQLSILKPTLPEHYRLDLASIEFE